MGNSVNLVSPAAATWFRSRHPIDLSLSMVDRYTPSVAIFCDGGGVNLISLRSPQMFFMSAFKSANLISLRPNHMIFMIALKLKSMQ